MIVINKLVSRTAYFSDHPSSTRWSQTSGLNGPKYYAQHPWRLRRMLKQSFKLNLDFASEASRERTSSFASRLEYRWRATLPNGELARRLTGRRSSCCFKEWLMKSIIFLTFTERSRVICRTCAREAWNCFTASSSIVTRIRMTETLMWYRCGYITIFNIRKGLVVLRREVGLPIKGKKNYWNNACVALWCLLLRVCALKQRKWPNKRPGCLFNFWFQAGCLMDRWRLFSYL